MSLHHSPPVEADIQLLGAHISTKGSCVEVAANPSGEEPCVVDLHTMGLYVVSDHCTWLMVLGKVYDGMSTTHNISYADDVKPVSHDVIFFCNNIKSMLFC